MAGGPAIDIRSPILRVIFNPGARRELRLGAIRQVGARVAEGKVTIDEGRQALRGCLRVRPDLGIDAEMAGLARTELRRLVDIQRPAQQDLSVDQILGGLTDMRVQLSSVSSMVRVMHDAIIGRGGVLEKVDEYLGELSEMDSQLKAKKQGGALERQFRLNLVDREALEGKIRDQQAEIKGRVGYINRVAGALANFSEQVIAQKLEGKYGLDAPVVNSVFTPEILAQLGLFEAQAKLHAAVTGEGKGLVELAQKALQLELMAAAEVEKRNVHIQSFEKEASVFESARSMPGAESILQGIRSSIETMNNEVKRINEKIKEINDQLDLITKAAVVIRDEAGKMTLAMRNGAAPAAQQIPPPPPPRRTTPRPSVPPAPPIIPPVAPPPAPVAPPAAARVSRPATPPPAPPAAPGVAPTPPKATLRAGASAAPPPPAAMLTVLGATPVVPTFDASRGIGENIDAIHAVLNPINKGKNPALEAQILMYLGRDIHTTALEQLALVHSAAGKKAEEVFGWLDEAGTGRKA